MDENKTNYDNCFSRYFSISTFMNLFNCLCNLSYRLGFCFSAFGLVVDFKILVDFRNKSGMITSEEFCIC